MTVLFVTCAHYERSCDVCTFWTFLWRMHIMSVLSRVHITKISFVTHTQHKHLYGDVYTTVGLSWWRVRTSSVVICEIVQSMSCWTFLCCFGSPCAARVSHPSLPGCCLMQADTSTRNCRPLNKYFFFQEYALRQTQTLNIQAFLSLGWICVSFASASASASQLPDGEYVHSISCFLITFVYYCECR